MYRHEHRLKSQLVSERHKCGEITGGMIEGDELDFYLNNHPDNWRLISVSNTLTVHNDECFDFYWWIDDN